MKKYLILLFSFTLVTYMGFTQVQATIKLGSQPNSVYIAFKSSVTLTAAKFSSFQFAVGIPDSVSAGVAASVTSLDPLITYTPLTSTETQDGVDYSVYSFSGDGAQTGSGTTYTAGVEYNIAEVFFTGGSVNLTDVRIMQLPEGGSNTQVNFYVANMGSDVTDVGAQFYSAVPANVSNDGNGYTGSSWATVGPVVLPVKFLGFTVIKKNNDAVLNWQIENESAIADRYEILRSLNGRDFKLIITVPVKNNGKSNNSYDLTDVNLSSHSTAIFYYRIKQVDKDGQFIYSEIRSLRWYGKGIAISIHPNPIIDFANVTIDIEQDADAMITINDAAGKQVKNIPVRLFKGPNIKKVNMGTLAAGSYMLKVQTGTEIKTIPVVKMN